jgi:hypothetical protein
MTTTTRPTAAEIADLMRTLPEATTPPAERTAWLDRKHELLAAVEVTASVSAPETTVDRVDIYAEYIDDDGYAATRLEGSFDPLVGEYFAEGKYSDGANTVSTITRSQFEHEGIFRTPDGAWVLNCWSRLEGSRETFQFIGDDEAKDWLIRSEVNDDALEKHFAARRARVLPLSEPCPVWCSEQEYALHRFTVGDDVFNDVRLHTAATRASDGRWTVSTAVADALACGGMVRGQASITLDVHASEELSAADAREIAAALVAAADKADAAAA